MAFREIPLPLRGLDLDSAPSKIPPGFAPSALNVRPFDPMTGKKRLSKRAGLSKYGGNRVNGLSPVRMVTSLCRPKNSRILTKGNLILQDQFDRADTAGGAAGLGGDWTIKEMTPFDMSGSGERVISNTTAADATDDPQIDGNTVISPGTAKYWACMYDTSTFTQPENTGRIIEIKFKTNTIAGLGDDSELTAIGLLTNIDNVAPPTDLLARISGIELDDFVGDSTWNFVLADDYIATRQNAATTTVQGVDVAPPRIALEPNKQYTLQMHVWRGQGTGGWYNIYLAENDAELAVVNGVSTATQPITQTNFHIGFWVRHVTTDAAVVAVDSFAYYEATLDYSRDSRCVIVAESDGRLGYSREDSQFSASYGSMDSALLSSNTVTYTERRPMGVWAPETSGLYYYFFSDGVRYGKFSFDTKNFYQWEDTSGSGDLPGAVGSAVANIVVSYRNRILLSGNPLEPDNIYASKIGDPVEWNYGTSAIDAWIASTGNLGPVPDSVTCLAPYSDDLCFVGGQRSLSIIRGDPNLDGVLDNVSSDLGVVGRFAWCRDDDGAMYFVGSQGLYRITGDNNVVMLSRGRLDNFFNSVDLSTESIALTWDSYRQGIWIVAINETVASKPAYFWDKRTDSFWQDEYAALIGPSAPIHFASMSGGSTSKTLLGGVDGYVRMVDGSEMADDGEAFTAHVDLGPFLGQPNQRIQLQGIRADMCENSGAVSVQVSRGATAEACIAASPQLQLTRTGPGRLRPIASNVGGNAVKVRFEQESATEGMSIERVFLDFGEGGVSTEDV